MVVRCRSVQGQVGAMLSSGSPGSSHKVQVWGETPERDPQLRGVSQPREAQDDLQATSPFCHSDYKTSLLFLRELVRSKALQVMVALHKTAIAEITKGPQHKVKYPMTSRNLDQLPVAGGKITIQPSKLLSFTLTWLREHL